MTKRFGRLFPALAVAAAGVAAAGAAATAGGAPPGADGYEVVASGLHNPRDLAFAPDGALYVAEAGTGGGEACFAGPGGAPSIGGATGGVTRVHAGRERRVVNGLPSGAEAGGVAAIGAHGIAFRGRRAVVTIGLRADPAARATGCGALGRSFGSLLALGPGRGTVLDVRAGHAVDLSAHEAAANPDGGARDSNPYGVLATPEGSFVADAGANALLYVTRRGIVSTVATFPSRAGGRGTDAVPTSVVRGRGALYVGELTGFPFARGAANVYSVVPGEEPRVHLDGFTAVIDLAAGDHGDLFVLEAATRDGLQGPGRLSRVGRDGTRTTIAEQGLVAPTAVAIARRRGLRGELRDLPRRRAVPVRRPRHPDPGGRRDVGAARTSTLASIPPPNGPSDRRGRPSSALSGARRPASHIRRPDGRVSVTSGVAHGRTCQLAPARPTNREREAMPASRDRGGPARRAIWLRRGRLAAAGEVAEPKARRPLPRRPFGSRAAN